MQVRGGSADSASVLGVVTVPLYDGGQSYSVIRQAKQIASQRRLEVMQARRIVEDAVATGWGSLQAACRTIIAAESQVAAATMALDGVRHEYLVGTRDTNDVLSEEAAVVEGQVAQLTARRDVVVASFALLAAMGDLTVEHLKLPVDSYDPALPPGNWTILNWSFPL